MNTSKLIDISKSSLIGLKTELLKKQEEVKKIKESQKNCVKPLLQQKRTSGSKKSNKGVEERSTKDTEQTEDDFDVLRKSRELLEAKARLYDKLKENDRDGEAKTQYLIDFDLKQEIYSNKTVQNEIECSNSQLSEEENAYSDSNSDPENDWVDFVDTLGRSRRCLRKDLLEMKSKDAKLAESLHPPSPPPAPEVTPELLSWDMQRELMRKKWEEQETMLLGKKDIHYQDVLFDEARPHGVGYFGFSTDESERQRQQQELKNIRKETMEQQDAAVGLRLRRQQQLEARLAAARRRKRERLGLPPEEPEVAEAIETVVAEPEEEEQHAEKIEDLEESIKKIAAVRPWDIGKPGASSVMSQEEWVEKKRSERPEEFAPPTCISEPVAVAAPSSKKQNIYNFKSYNKGDSDTFNYNNSSQNNFGETRCSSSSDFSRTKSDIPLSNFHKTTFHNPSSEQITNDSLYKNNPERPITNVNTSSHTNTKRKPTSEDIDNLLSKSKEKLIEYKEAKNKMGSFVGVNAIGERNKDVYSPVNSSKVTNNKNYNLTNKSNTSGITLINEIVYQSDEVTRPDSDVTNNESYSKGRTIEDNSILDTSSTTVFRNINSGNKRKWAEIPPPPSMSYYNNAAGGPSKVPVQSSSKTNISESISVGLNFLKSKEKKVSRVKGLLDIV